MSLTSDQIVAKNFKKYHEAILPYLNGSAHSGFTPIGTVISVMGTTAPLNYLACDGTVYNISDYPELAAYFNAQFGSSNFFGGNGTTTFAVPDLRGEFLRGTGTNSHTNQGNGANVGVHQDATSLASTSGGYLLTRTEINGLIKNYDSSVHNSGTDKYVKVTENGNGYDDFTVRPTNTSVLYCIASKNIFMDAGSNYSTEEQVVGTWIDGKPIYQKVMYGGNAVNDSIVLHNIKNVDLIFCSLAILHSKTEKHTEILPCYNNSSDYLGRVIVSETYFKLIGTNTWVNYDYYVVLNYTKTTD